MEMAVATRDLDFGRVDVGIVAGGAERGDGLGGGLDAAEEGGDEGSAGRRAEPEPQAGAPRPRPAAVGDRRVPGPRCRGRPPRIRVVDPVAVPHYHHALHRLHLHYQLLLLIHGGSRRWGEKNAAEVVAGGEVGEVKCGGSGAAGASAVGKKGMMGLFYWASVDGLGLI